LTVWLRFFDRIAQNVVKTVKNDGFGKVKRSNVSNKTIDKDFLVI
jgi:hypothetical protein